MAGHLVLSLLPPDVQLLPGAVLVNHGEVYPILDFVEVQYKIDPLLALNDNLVSELKSIQAFQALVDSDTVLTPAHKSLLRSSIISTIQHATTVIPHQKTRHARGLINFIGNLQHTLFGVIDEATLEGRLQQYDRKLSAVAHSVESSATSVNTLQKNVELLRNSVQQLNLQSANLDDLSETQRFAQLSFVFTQLQFALQRVTYSANTLQQSILAAGRGVVEPSLISPHEFTLITANLHLDKDAKPLFKPGTTPAFYNTLESFITKKGLSILIPLYPDSIYSLHSVHPFPMPTNTSNMHATLSVAPTIISCTKTQTIIIPTEPITTSCSQPKDGVYICFNPTWHMDINTPTCERAVVADQHMLTTHCTYNRQRNAVTPFFLPLPTLTLIYFYIPTRATISCGHKPQSLTISGTYSLPHTCSIRSKHLNIKASHSFTAAFARLPTKLKPTDFLVPMPNSKHFNLNLTLHPMDPLSTNPILPPSSHLVDYIYPLGLTFIFAVPLTLLGIYTVIRIKSSNLELFGNLNTKLESMLMSLVEGSTVTSGAEEAADRAERNNKEPTDID